MAGVELLEGVRGVAESADFDAVAVAVYDYESGVRFSLHGDRWFHAASTMKVGVLYALLDRVSGGKLQLDDTLHVRNRFKSVVDGSIFKVEGGRDGDSVVHGRIGRTMRLEDLAHAMITRSSNLATNLLVDFLGVELIRGAIEAAGVTGFEVVRGVEDDKAFDEGINNRVTADGLLRLFRLFCEDGPLPQEAREKALSILYEQEFNRMIPAGLPDEARVAHKTGEISSVCHDAGIVALPDRKPYVVAILSEGGSGVDSRKRAVAKISKLIFESLIGKARGEGSS